MDCMLGVLDRIETLENRLEVLEKGTSLRNYAEAAASPPAPDPPQSKPSNDRLDRLEFLASEDERKKRFLEVSIKHPEINKEATDLEDKIKSFLTEKLNMENREIDPNMKIYKLPRDNTIRLVLSDIKYKRFLFSTRKKIRIEQPRFAEDLFINENLSTYNFGILMSLKTERKKREEKEEPNFDSVYSFEGRIFVKKTKNSDRSTAILISSKKSLDNFLSQLGNST